MDDNKINQVVTPTASGTANKSNLVDLDKTGWTKEEIEIHNDKCREVHKEHYIKPGGFKVGSFVGQG